MRKNLCGVLALGVIILIILPYESARANISSQVIPENYSVVIKDEGVVLYQKNGTSLNFIQAADLSQGASVVLMHGNISDAGVGDGAYGGDNPTFTRQIIKDVWDGISSNPNAFCVTNGGFFSTNVDPAPLAFPIKKDGKILSDGYGKNEFLNQKLILELWEDRADIVPLTRESLYNSSAPNILGGLTEDANKGVNELNYRTFVGIVDQDNNGKYETVLLFTSSSTTQIDAAETLRSFGAEKIMMLDGGGSTQFVCRGKVLIPSSVSRRIPQTIAIYKQAPPPLAMEVVSQPNFPVLIEGETLSITTELRNTGSETWTSNEFYLLNVKNPWGAGNKLLLPHNVEPGATVVLSWTTNKFSSWGVYSTEWQLAKGNEKFRDKLTIRVIVIPKELSDKKEELEKQIKEWIDEQAKNIEELIIAWIKEQINKKLGNIWPCSSATILPLVVFAFLSRAHSGMKNK